MEGTLLLYGCYGYTGTLILKHLLALEVKPLLGGRDEKRVSALAQEFGLPYVTGSASDLGKILAEHPEVKVLLNCAGPFRFTAREAMEACITHGVHYLDITGEIEVFELAASMGEKARKASVMLMPGTGYDVVPSDCMAAHLAQRLPGATHLELSMYSKGGSVSHGTAITIIENLGEGSMERMGGKLFVTKSGEKVKTVNFGGSNRTCVAIPWGDVSTAYYTTGIPNIAVYNAASPSLIKNMKRSNYLGFVLKTRLVKDYLIRQVKKRPAGPDEKVRNQAKVFIHGLVWNAEGKSHSAMLELPEGYWLTALTAARIGLLTLQGKVSPGFRTPAMQYGADFILQFEKVNRTDLS